MNTVDYSTSKDSILKEVNSITAKDAKDLSRTRRINIGEIGGQNRVNSNYRNESLERILGDKANTLFDQLEKIQSKEYLKLNRSIININDRGDSINRQTTSTPILLMQTSTPAEEPKRQVQRKRQMTFTNSNPTTQTISSNVTIRMP